MKPDRNHTHTWIELSVTVPEELSDLLVEEAVSITGRGVICQDLPSPSGSETRVTMYLDPARERECMEEITAFLQGLHAESQFRHPFPVEKNIIPQENWAEAWKASFKPIRIGDRFVVRPSWETYSPRPSDLVIEIDPGQAFGTGTHATTSLVLEELERLISRRAVRSLLDIGTGTGILAIGAALLGIPQVTGLDIDPVAVAAAQENTARNRVDKTVTMTGLPLEEINGTFDAVLANLDRETLLSLAGKIRSLIAPGGTLIVSGILDTQVEAVRNAVGLSVREIRTRQDESCAWAAVIFEAG